jgi:hypothetical protein
MRPLGAEEVWARNCIREALPGCTVNQHDDGSEPSMYDLTITYPDGHTGAVEVTAAVDAQALALWKLVRRQGKPWIEPTLAGGWLVYVKPSARAKNLIRHLPDLLRDMERGGRHVVSGDQASTDQASVVASQLGIVQALRGPTEHLGTIYIMPPEQPLEQMGGCSPTTGDPLARWVSEWVSNPSRADNLWKLERSGARERHLFILVPGFDSGSFAVSDLLIALDAPLPTIPPALPAEITHVWAASTWDSGDGFRWSPDVAWERFVKVEP